MNLELNGKSYQIVTLDFETYYDKEYTLSGKLSTSEYIRDARFHAHGVGIKVGEAPTMWYTGKNIRLALNQIDWSKSAMLCHNTPFDGFICSHHYGIVPAIYLDTLSMARGSLGHHMRHDLNTVATHLGFAGKTKRAALADTKGKQQLTGPEEAALGAYCIDDVDDTLRIFEKLYNSFSDDELRLIHITTRLFCDPILGVDLKRVQDELEQEVSGKIAALLQSGANVEDLLSNEKFANLLRAAGEEPPKKVSPSTGQLTYAFAKTDLNFQALEKSKNPKVSALALARRKVKSTIGETRAVRFLEAGKDGMKLPVMLNYCGAHTTRWSGGNKMNLQNLKRGGELRKSIKAPKGHVLVVADSAQIEARITAWLAGQTDLINQFANREDVYSLFASLIWGRHIDRKRKVTDPETGKETYPDFMEGFIGKTCVLGLGYGMGAMKLQSTLAQGTNGPAVNLDLSECKRIVNLYRSKNWKIQEYWKAMDGVITNMLHGMDGTIGPIQYGKGYIKLPNGLFLQYYGLHGEASVRHGELITTEATYLTRYGRNKLYGGLLTENVVQALARVVIGEQILAIEDLGYRTVMCTHDEIIVTCPKGKAKQCLADMLRIMSTPPDWAPGLPLFAEGDWAENYSK